MIFAEDLTKLFDDFVAVNSVNLDVKAGEVLILLGPNGAGKTTTVRMLTSILKPTRGHAIIAGYDVVNQANEVRTAVGVLTEHHGLYGRMNSVEYLTFFGQLYHLDRRVIQQRSNELLDRFGLGDARKKRLGEYSKGMRQKLALVRAMLHDPPVLLLDEPTSAMDPESAHLVRDAIKSLRSADRTIMLCTHNLVEAEELADKVAIIRNGRVIEHDSLSSLKQKLLGPTEYIAHTTRPVDGWQPVNIEGVIVSGRGEDWIRFQIHNPQVNNPGLLQQMITDQIPVVSFQEVNRSLEQAYLLAIHNASSQEAGDVI